MVQFRQFKGVVAEGGIRAPLNNPIPSPKHPFLAQEPLQERWFNGPSRLVEGRTTTIDFLAPTVLKDSLGQFKGRSFIS